MKIKSWIVTFLFGLGVIYIVIYGNINSTYIGNNHSPAVTESISEDAIESIIVGQVIEDYLELDSDSFKSKYGNEELYKEGILYCDEEAWKYNGEQLDAFQNPNDYYEINDISAIRIIKGQENPVYNGINVGDEVNGEEIEKVLIDYYENYAVSVYYANLSEKSNEDNSTLGVKEISFVKVELKKGEAPESLYSYLEQDYYRVRKSLENEMWVSSPNGEKEACVSNGELPKHPSQIFIRNKNDVPDIIFRRNWEQRIVGWLDDEHLICDEIDAGGPLLIHLESHEIERIKTENDDYDTYGAKYKIDGNYLIAKWLDEEIYRWKIDSKNEEIFIVSE